MRRALVIGGGSIGLRHVEVLRNCGVEVALASRHLAPETFISPEEAFKTFEPDYAVIANRTAEHGKTLERLRHDCGFHGICLCEKPLFAGAADAPFADDPDTLVGYVLRFHPVVRRIRRLLEGKEVFSAEFYVGQYLPDWRPGTDYRKCYSARKKEGGGALRDLSHELDLACFLCGPWRKVTAQLLNSGQLEIDCEDQAVLLMETVSGTSCCCRMNYLDRNTARELRIQYEGGTIYADLPAGRLCHNGLDERYDITRNTIFETMHLAVLRAEPAFAGTVCSYAEGMELMKLIEAAELSAKEGKWIYRK